MKNITLSIPDDIARWARVWAAEHDTSVSKMLSGFLEEKMNEEVIYKKAMTSFLAKEPVPLRNNKDPLPSREDLYGR